MIEDYLDEIEEDIDDVEPIDGDAIELYEHFRVVVDKGQAPIR
ncbi:MAG: RNA pseudouridine synthase, partial [Bacteroidaceae bacterium]